MVDNLDREPYDKIKHTLQTVWKEALVFIEQESFPEELEKKLDLATQAVEAAGWTTFRIYDTLFQVTPKEHMQKLLNKCGETVAGASETIEEMIEGLQTVKSLRDIYDLADPFSQIPKD